MKCQNGPFILRTGTFHGTIQAGTAPLTDGLTTDIEGTQASTDAAELMSASVDATVTDGHPLEPAHPAGAIIATTLANHAAIHQGGNTPPVPPASRHIE